MEMVMPSMYRALGNDEMMYLDGGWSFNFNWWGTTLYLKKDECRNLTYGYSILGVVVALQPVAVASVGLAGVCAQYGADHNGVWIHRTWSGQKWPIF